MSSLLHQSLCKNRRQNTITGLLKKMSEKKVQDSSLQICVRPERTKGMLASGNTRSGFCS